MESTTVRLLGVGKRYGRDHVVLADVNLELGPGELIAITGSNGSGKSTLLRMLVGASRPTTGTVTGRPREIGYVPEHFPSDERMSARSYLVHMGRLRGLAGTQAGDRASELLDRLELTDGRNTPLRRLSKGNLQKVALAQALLVRPGLLVLDEPWSGLDSSAHAILADIMSEVADAGGTVVFTDHRESVVRTNAGHVYQISNGRVGPLSPDLEHDLVTRLVLEAPVGGMLDDASMTLPAALSVRRDNRRVTVRVAKTGADHLLLSALQRGWSVVRVDEAVTERTATSGDAQ